MTTPAEKRERIFVRLSSADKERAKYWAAKRGFSSVNEYAAEAVAEKIARENGDFAVPNLIVGRLNQIIDELKSLSLNTGNLERSMTMGMDSLLGLTRGGNYLLDSEDGELL